MNILRCLLFLVAVGVGPFFVFDLNLTGYKYGLYGSIVLLKSLFLLKGVAAGEVISSYYTLHGDWYLKRGLIYFL